VSQTWKAALPQAVEAQLEPDGEKTDTVRNLLSQGRVRGIQSFKNEYYKQNLTI
jgi:hypothetical protein